MAGVGGEEAGEELVGKAGLTVTRGRSTVGYLRKLGGSRNIDAAENVVGVSEGGSSEATRWGGWR